MKWFNLLLINVCFGFVILELFSFLLVKNNLWGAWHKKNAIAQHIKQCFKSEYRSNSIGARDDKFLLNGPKEKNLILVCQLYIIIAVNNEIFL